MALDPVSAALDIGGKLIDRMWPDPAKRAEAQLELLKLAQAGDLAQLNADLELAKGQLAVNAAEAANASGFVSGWRPMVGWVCAAGLGYQFVGSPLLTWGAALLHHPIATPELDMSTLLTLLLGMLGLGGMRSLEKIKGVAK